MIHLTIKLSMLSLQLKREKKKKKKKKSSRKKFRSNLNFEGRTRHDSKIHRIEAVQLRQLGSYASFFLRRMITLAAVIA